MTDKTDTNPLWRYAATLFGGFILAMVIALSTEGMRRDDFNKEAYLKREDIVNLINTKISRDTPYSKDKAGIDATIARLRDDIKERKEEDKETRKAIVELRKAISDLSVGIAAWTKAVKERDKK